jgi:hypothetical protein
MGVFTSDPVFAARRWSLEVAGNRAALADFGGRDTVVTGPGWGYV